MDEVNRSVKLHCQFGSGLQSEVMHTAASKSTLWRRPSQIDRSVVPYPKQRTSFPLA